MLYRPAQVRSTANRSTPSHWADQYLWILPRTATVLSRTVFVLCTEYGLEGNDLSDFGGPGRVRTVDLFHAMEARSQLRHRPLRSVYVHENNTPNCVQSNQQNFKIKFVDSRLRRAHNRTVGAFIPNLDCQICSPLPMINAANQAHISVRNLSSICHVCNHPLDGDDAASRQLCELTHELRQPLSTIESLAFYLEITSEDDRLQKHLEQIRSMIETANVILDRAASASGR